MWCANFVVPHGFTRKLTKLAKRCSTVRWKRYHLALHHRSRGSIWRQTYQPMFVFWKHAFIVYPSTGMISTFDNHIWQTWFETIRSISQWNDLGRDSLSEKETRWTKWNERVMAKTSLLFLVAGSSVFNCYFKDPSAGWDPLPGLDWNGLKMRCAS